MDTEEQSRDTAESPTEKRDWTEDQPLEGTDEYEHPNTITYNIQYRTV